MWFHDLENLVGTTRTIFGNTRIQFGKFKGLVLSGKNYHTDVPEIRTFNQNFTTNCSVNLKQVVFNAEMSHNKKLEAELNEACLLCADDLLEPHDVADALFVCFPCINF